MNHDQRAQALQEKADALFKELQVLKADTELLLGQVSSRDSLQISEDSLAKALAIRSELGISEQDLANMQTKFHVLDEKHHDCHWCTASGGK